MGSVMISISKEFNPAPAGRTPADGPFNGQRFREQLLIPAVMRAAEGGGQVVVDFDGADSYSSSFLEEAFGGLVRSRVVSNEVIAKTLRLKADDPAYTSYVLDAQTYIKQQMLKSR